MCLCVYVFLCEFFNYMHLNIIVLLQILQVAFYLTFTLCEVTLIVTAVTQPKEWHCDSVITVIMVWERHYFQVFITRILAILSCCFSVQKTSYSFPFTFKQKSRSRKFAYINVICLPVIISCCAKLLLFIFPIIANLFLTLGWGGGGGGELIKNCLN